MVPGILRILGNAHRENDIPRTKKHELFIPMPSAFVTDQQDYLQNANAFLIPPDVIDSFEKIAEKQTDSQKQENIAHDAERLPFNLKGTSRRTDHTLKIKQGDLVYFRPDESGNNVAEISFSSIWRCMADGTTSDFSPDENLLPFNRERTSLSPAELLFGFTENNEGKGEYDHGLAFTGKVRISAGTLPSGETKQIQDDLLGEEITLKALAAPKPPSPAFYFNNRRIDQDYIEKIDLKKMKHELKGRKIYLHGMREEKHGDKIQKITPAGRFAEDTGDGDFPWISRHNERNHLKARCRPIKEGTEFYFHLDFNNLTKWEIGLLCYALRPDETFRHKIGMGKPIGLGTVKIDIAALQTINRYNRYANATQDEDRYNGGGWIKEELKNQVTALYEIGGIRLKGGGLSPNDCKNTFIETMDADIYRAIELLGNPENINSPVHYPQVDKINGVLANIEKENFNWFGKNNTEMLETISKNTIQLKPFTRYV